MSKQIRVSDEAFDKIVEKKGRMSLIGFIDELVIDNNFNEPKEFKGEYEENLFGETR